MQVPPWETVDVPVFPALSVYPLLMFIQGELLRLFRKLARMSATSGWAAQSPYLRQEGAQRLSASRTTSRGSAGNLALMRPHKSARQRTVRVQRRRSLHVAKAMEPQVQSMRTPVTLHQHQAF